MELQELENANISIECPSLEIAKELMVIMEKELPNIVFEILTPPHSINNKIIFKTDERKHDSPMFVVDYEYFNKPFLDKKESFEDKPKETPINLVPDSIRIIDCTDNGLGLGLLFNDKQILSYDEDSKNYIVGIGKGLLGKKTPCQFIDTKFKDIKAGDIYIEYGLNNLNPSNYFLKLEGKEYAKINMDKNVEVYDCDIHKNQSVLKLVPINK